MLKTPIRATAETLNLSTTLIRSNTMGKKESFSKRKGLCSLKEMKITVRENARVGLRGFKNDILQSSKKFF